MQRHRQAARTVEYALPQLRHLGLGQVIARRIRQEDRKALYRLVPGFLVLLPTR